MDSFGFATRPDRPGPAKRRLVPVAAWRLEPEAVQAFGQAMDDQLLELEQQFRSYWTHDSLKGTLRRS